jgi:hypothetical protein
MRTSCALLRVLLLTTHATSGKLLLAQEQTGK